MGRRVRAVMSVRVSGKRRGKIYRQLLPERWWELSLPIPLHTQSEACMPNIAVGPWWLESGGGKMKIVVSSGLEIDTNSSFPATVFKPDRMPGHFCVRKVMARVRLWTALFC